MCLMNRTLGSSLPYVKDSSTVNSPVKTIMGFYRNHIVPHLVNLAMRNRELAPYRERIIALARVECWRSELGLG